jgi:hypothetical protein
MALYYLNGKWVYKAENENNPTYANGGLQDLPETYTESTDEIISWAPDEYGEYQPVYGTQEVTNEGNVTHNRLNKKKNEDNIAANEKAKKKNQYEAEAWQIINSTKGADYLPQVGKITNSSWGSTQLGKDIKNSFDTWYKEQKIGAGWNIDLGAKPPAGDFDPNYYLSENPDVKAQWDYAVKIGDLDITALYKSDKIFALQNYTYSGKPAGKRGNKAQELTEAKQYLEKKPTDSDIQGIKDKQLGISYEALKDVKPGTELEEIASEEIGADIVKKTKQFGALTQDVLKDTIQEMQKAKAQEQLLSMMGGLPGFQEILNINQTLSDSILLAAVAQRQKKVLRSRCKI